VISFKKLLLISLLLETYCLIQPVLAADCLSALGASTNTCTIPALGLTINSGSIEVPTGWALTSTSQTISGVVSIGSAVGSNVTIQSLNAGGGINFEGTTVSQGLVNYGYINGFMTGGSNNARGIYLNTSTIANGITNYGAIYNDWLGSVYLNTSSVSGGLNNSGTITGGVYEVYLQNNSHIDSVNNTGVMSNNVYVAIELADSLSSIGLIANSGGGLISGKYAAIENGGHITSITNSVGSLITNSTANGGGIFNDYGTQSSIGSIINEGTISATTGVNRFGIFNDGSIGTITNTGSITASGSGSYEIKNDGTIATLNNRQGLGNSYGALTYTGALPTNYNIIIDATHYGQLSVTSSTGSTVFGIYTGSTVSNNHIYSSVLSGITASQVTNTSGTYGGYNWTLGLKSGSSTIWDLLFGTLGSSTGPSIADTQFSLQSNVAALQGVYALQTGTVNNSLTYDCNNFGAKGFCVSTGGRYSNASESTANTTSAMIIAGYRINDHLRIGASADQNLYNTDVAQIASVRSNTPLMGAFAVWNQNADRTGLETKVAAGYNNSDLNVNRVAVGTSEVGQGRTALNTLSESIMASYAFKLGENYRLSPYAGVRHTTVSANGYAEQGTTNVTAPLSYNALNQESTTALLGVRLAGQVYKNTTVQTSAGFEEDMHNSVNNYSATGLAGLTAITFNPNIQRTRAVVNFGASYELAKAHHLSFNTIYRQESFQGVDTKMAYVNYTMGF
jgi:hypothetical protein